MVAEHGGGQDPVGPNGEPGGQGEGVNVPVPPGPVDANPQPAGPTLPQNPGAAWDARLLAQDAR